MSKKLKDKINEKRQFRSLKEVRAAEGKENIFNSEYYVEGYAATFKKYKLIESSEGDIYEEFDKKCFDKADMSDVIFQYNHEGRVFARLSNDTLKIEVDENGLKVMADLSKSAEGRNLHEEIKNGLTTKMSWGFRPGIYGYDEVTRTIKHETVNKIYDVSAVSIPANDGTSISARSLVDGEFEKLHEESQKRKRLQMLVDLQINEIKNNKSEGK